MQYTDDEALDVLDLVEDPVFLANHNSGAAAPPAEHSWIAVFEHRRG